VRFVLLEDTERTRGVGRARRYRPQRTAVQQAISAWVRERGVLVDPDRWYGAVADSGRPVEARVQARLYDLAGEVQ
jgi:hypothetical protein